MNKARSNSPWVGRVACAAVLATLAGCTPAPRAQDDQPQATATTPTGGSPNPSARTPEFVAATPESLVARARVDVPGGQVVLIPLEPAVGAKLVGVCFGDSRVNAWLDRGNARQARAVDARLVRVVRRADPTGADAWLGDPGAWSSMSVDQVRAAPVDGVWALVVDLFGPNGDALDDLVESDDAGEAVGAAVLRVGPTAEAPIVDFTVNPLPARDRLVRTAGPQTPWRPLLSESDRADVAVVGAISPESRSPITRWRARLLTDGLDPAAPAPAPFGDQPMEVLAQQNEDRWRVALAWLWFANPDVAQRLKARIAAVARFAAPSVTGQAAAKGRLAPLWPLDHADLDTLLAELLEPRIDAAQRVALAERWLARQPGAAAWIHDDGGVLAFADGDPVIVATVGVVNLLDRPTLAWTTLSDGEVSPDLVPVASMSGVLLSRPIPASRAPDRQTRQIGTRLLTAHLGQATAALAVSAMPLPVTPPGAALGPYLPDWTMADFQSAAPGAIDGAWGTAALVHKASGPDRADAWEVFVECRVPVGARGANVDPSREAATLFVGPSGAPGAVVRVSRDGTVAATGPLGEAFPKLVEVVRSDDRWSFRLRLDPRVIEDRGVLRLGLMRSDAMGRRWAFPRSMLPWELEPARVALDLAAWDQ